MKRSTIGALLALLAGTALTTPPSASALPGSILPNNLCDGHQATVVGTGGNDVFFGGPGNDVFVLWGGDDTVFPSAGTDRVCGGTGNDTLHGGTGNDVLSGGSGNDRLIGGADFDYLSGGDGNDIVDAVASDNGAADTALGDAGNDELRTNDGVGGDVANGGTAIDTCGTDAGDVRSSCELLLPWITP